MTGWNNELLQIGSFTVYGYGLMIAIGVIVAYTVGEYRAKKQGLNPDELFWLTISCLVGGIIGAKLLFYIVEIKSIIENPKILLDITHGFVVYGGIIGGIGVGYLFCKLRKLEFLKYFDLVMPSIAIAQGFGRVGCMFAGCCYGRETDSWFHVIYETSEFAPNGVALIPTQLLMAGLNFAHFLILVFLEKKVLKASGQVAGCYLVFYSIGRFFLEFLRNDPRGNVNSLSTSQFISLFILLAGVGTILFCGYLGKKRASAVDKTDADAGSSLKSTAEISIVNEESEEKGSVESEE
ncbi:MAG: prolipoprotein diacylglyceryl transferase [Lachnospiraceae bacterium]|nr:prolipoprotein diacylglyceryl transferase [Lachnospiraceae bacterium]